MGLASIDPQSQKEHTEIHKMLIGHTGIKNVKNLRRNVWKCGQIRTSLVRICPHFHTFLVSLCITKHKWFSDGLRNGINDWEMILCKYK